MVDENISSCPYVFYKVFIVLVMYDFFFGLFKTDHLEVLVASDLNLVPCSHFLDRLCP